MNPVSKGARLGVVVALTLGLAAGACSNDDNKSDSSSSSTSSGSTKELAAATLNGSGSTFQKPFDDEVIAAFKDEQGNVTITYAGGGSGQGKTDLAGQLVDFAGTDSLVKPEDVASFRGGAFLYFPTVAAPITVSYKLSGVDKLQLSPDTIAKIFQRDITTWDDEAIKADNPDADLPSTDITVVHRSDGSGTTSNFTKYLDAAAKGTWTLGSGDTVAWPSDTVGGNGNAGIVSGIQAKDGAIGYVDFSDAKAAQLTFASIQNKAGNYVEPSVESTQAALADTEVNDDLTYSPLNSSGEEAYPIATPTWILVYKMQTDTAKGEALKAFLEFIYREGQAMAPDLDYAPLPDSTTSKAVAQLDQLEIG
jgi:phosphate transport system substrate-binding protein